MFKIKIIKMLEMNVQLSARNADAAANNSLVILVAITEPSALRHLLFTH